MEHEPLPPRTRVLRALTPLLALALLAATGTAGCTSDPTASNEYQALAQQLATAEQQLAAVTAERDALAARPGPMTSVELPAEAAAALGNYGDAVLAADGERMLNYVTDEFRFLSYGDLQPPQAYADWVTRYYSSFKVESLGDQLVLGDGDTYIVAAPERATTPALADGFSVLRLVRKDGVWLVDTHRFTGQ